MRAAPSCSRTRLLPRTPIVRAALLAGLGLVGCGGGSDAPPRTPTITAAPQAQTVAEGEAATFTVAGTSDAGALRYEWSVEGVGTIGGATTASYRIDAVALDDHGKRFVATLRNDAGSTASPAATLSVTERRWAATANRPMGAAASRDDMAAAVDSTGMTHLAYAEITSNGSTSLALATKPAHSPIALSGRGTGGFPQAPWRSHQQLQLVPGSGGVVLVLWREGVADEVGNVLAAGLLYDQGNGYASLGAFSDPQAVNAANPQAAWISDDTLEVVFRQHDGQRWNVVTRRLTLNAQRTGGQWAAIASVESLDANLGAPRIASDGRGNAIVAFSAEGGVYRSYANTRSAEATDWQAAGASEVSGLADTTNARVAGLAMNAQGRAVLLMRSDETRVYMRPFRFGGSAPGWQSTAAYVANRWDGLPDDVDPVALFEADDRFSIYSIHNNGQFASRWTCTNGNCGAPQTFVDAGSQRLRDLRAAVDGAGNVMVAYAMALGDDPARPHAVRFHRGLNAWRPAAPVGPDTAASRLHLAVAANGQGTVLFGTEAEGLLPRTVDYR